MTSSAPWLSRLPIRSRVLRDGAWVGAGQVIGALARLAGLSVLTGLVSPAVYGEVALFLGISVLAAGSLYGPLFQAALRFYPDAARDGRVNGLRRITVAVLVRASAVVFALLALGAVVGSVGSHGRPDAPVLALLLGAVVFGDLVRTFETSLLSAARRQGTWAAWTAVDACTRPLGSVIAVLLAGGSTAAVLAGQAVAGIVTNLAFSSAAVRGDDGPDDPGARSWHDATRAEFLRFALPLAPLALLGWVVNLGDRYVLAATGGTAAVGEYAAVYGLASLPFLLCSGIGLTTFRPILFDAVARDDHAKEKHTVLAWLAAVGAASALGVLGIGILGAAIVHLVLGKPFWGGAPLLPWIAAAYAMQGVQVVFETMMYAQRRTKRVVVLHSLGAATGLVLYAVLIPPLGAKGAAIATFVAFSCSCFAGLLLAGAHSRLGRRASGAA